MSDETKAIITLCSALYSQIDEKWVAVIIREKGFYFGAKKIETDEMFDYIFYAIFTTYLENGDNGEQALYSAIKSAIEQYHAEYKPRGSLLWKIMLKIIQAIATRRSGQVKS